MKPLSCLFKKYYLCNVLSYILALFMYNPKEQFKHYSNLVFFKPPRRNFITLFKAKISAYDVTKY